MPRRRVYVTLTWYSSDSAADGPPELAVDLEERWTGRLECDERHWNNCKPRNAGLPESLSQLDPRTQGKTKSSSSGGLHSSKMKFLRWMRIRKHGRGFGGLLWIW